MIFHNTTISLKRYLLPFTCLLFFIAACQQPVTKANSKTPVAAGTAEGALLAANYCSRCHSFTDPSLLDRTTWTKSVLPAMATKLGIEVFGGLHYVNEPGNKSAISFDNWMKIVRYYEKNAPLDLSKNDSGEAIKNDWSIFKLKKSDFKILPFAKTMLVVTDTIQNRIYTSDGNTNILYCWNNLLQIVDTTLLYSPAVSGTFYNEGKGNRSAAITTLGTMIASDISEGNLLHVSVSKKLHVLKDTIAQNMPRPVQSITADFNHDGKKDWLICGFGHNKGALLWYEKLINGKYTKHIISSIPGAVHAEVQDFNNDGWDDMMVLFAHDDECIKLFVNNKQGGFVTTKLLQFLPVAGSSGFQLIDINKDGLQDIIYTCGDNADLSPILKPYHGIYIYLNKGNLTFEQSWFYPVNGCTKAVAADFDQDGDIDIASIAFFADFKNKPAEKFLYFEQQDQLRFVPHAPPIEKNGRWICMDVADYDGDGDKDIILGNFARGFLNTKNFKPDWDINTPFIVLENTTSANYKSK